MNFQNEQQILKIVRYVPSLFLVFVTLIILSFLYYENIKAFTYQKANIQKNHIAKSKELIQERVENLYSKLQINQESIEENLKKTLHTEMDKAFSILNAIYIRNLDEDPNIVKRLMKDALRDLRYNNGRGYFFIHDKEKFANAMHPIMPQLEGKSSYNVKDARGRYIIREMHEALKDKTETFFEWYWYKPNDKKVQHKKIGIIKNFEPFNWFIGTGEYVADFEKEQKKNILNEIASINQNKSSYIFVLRYDGLILSHPLDEYLNKNLLHDKGREYIKDIIDTAKNGGGFIEYVQKIKPNTSHSAKKTTYVKGLEIWPWIIGTGFYDTEVNEMILMKKEELNNSLFTHMKNTIIVSFILTFLLLLVSLYLESIIKKKFKKYNDEINKHLNDKIEQQNILAQQAKMAAMGDMIGNIAHQWRQPLSSITTSASSMLLQSDLDILEKQDIKDGLHTINKRAMYLSNTIDDFRNFFNTEKDSSTFKIEQAITDSISIINAKLNNENIKIVKNIEDIEITNLKNELMQVIINILNNARDALENQEDEKLIFIDVYKKDEKAIINIKDNAGGIKEEILNKIYEPYFTTKHQSQGTGIGLYMSKQIVEKNLNATLITKNKTYTYKGKDYKGAQFKVILS